MLSAKNLIMKDIDRLQYFLSNSEDNFTRKDYMNVLKDISTATASRDLKKAIELNLVIKEGELNKASYRKL